MHRILITAALLTLLSCHTTTAAESALAANRRLWVSRAPASYTVTVSRSCECTPEMTGPVVVTVRGGVVESRVYASNGAAVGGSLAAEFPSVEEMFQRIEELTHREVAKLDVSYDRATGYPTLVSVDYDARMVDDEISWRITSLAPLSTAGR